MTDPQTRAQRLGVRRHDAALDGAARRPAPPTPRYSLLVTFAAAIAALSLTGCTTQPALRNDVDRLIDTPGFSQAMVASPAWTSEALRTIAGLNRELNTLP